MKGRGEMTNEIFKHISVWNIRVPKINFKKLAQKMIFGQRNE